MSDHTSGVSPSATAHLVRHGWTDWRAGSPPELAGLTDAGVARIRATAERLRGRQPTLVVTSPLTRALHSAHVLTTQLGLDLRVDADLREWQPDRSGRPVDRSAFGQLLARPNEVDGPGPVPWETLPELRGRVRRTLDRHRAAGTVFVSHGVAIHAVSGRDLPPGGLLTVSRADVAAGGPAEPPGSPVTPAHRWRLDELRARPGACQVAGLLLPEAVDVTAVDEALRSLVAADELLGSRFARSGDDYVRHRLDDPDVACAVVVGVTHLAHLRREAARALDPLDWPLLRVTLVPGDPSLLCLAVSPLVADRRSPVGPGRDPRRAVPGADEAGVGGGSSAQVSSRPARTRA